MNGTQRAAAQAALDAWLDANRPGHTSTGATLLDFVDKLRRYSQLGLDMTAKYTTVIKPIVDALPLTITQRNAVRDHCLGL